MKRKLILIGSILSFVTIPVMTISCSTTWTKWKKDNNPIQTTTKFSKFKYANIEKWEVRKDVDRWSSLVFDQKTHTIDLEKVRNQFELNIVLAHILGLISQKSADEYWDDFPGMKTFLEQLTKKIDLHFKYKNKTTTITWDITAIVNKGIKGIDDFAILKPNERNQARKSDAISLSGLNDNGIPINFSSVAKAAGSLIENKTVASLLEQDSTFALKLSKLVNLPRETFDAFVTLMSVIDQFMDEVYKTQYREQNKVKNKDQNKEKIIKSPTGQLIKDWFSKDEKDLAYNVSPSNGAFYDQLSSSYNKPWTEWMKGEFIIGALKREGIKKNR